MKNIPYSKTALGIYIRQLRERMGSTRKDLARVCGVTPAYISLIESGDRAASVEVAYSLAGALGVPPISLLVLMDNLPEGLIQDLRERDELKNRLVTERLRGITAVFMPKSRNMTGAEILEYLEKDDPEHLRIIHERTAGKRPELQNLPVKEGIMNAVAQEFSESEALILNEIPDPGLPGLEPPEMLVELKETFGWTWKRLGAEFGVCTRTVPRWVNRESQIPKKARRRIDYLYWVVLSQARGVTKSPESTAAELAGGKTAKVFGMNNPFATAAAGGIPPINQVARTRNAYHRKGKRMVPIPQQKQLPANTNNAAGREGKREGGNKTTSSGDDDGGEGDDPAAWLLNKRKRNLKIQKVTNQVFDKLRTKLAEVGAVEDLLKEVRMRLYQCKKSGYWYVVFTVPGKLRERFSTHFKDKAGANRVLAELEAKAAGKQQTWGATLLAETPTLKEAAGKYVAEYCKPRANHRWRNVGPFNHVVTALGNLRLPEVTSAVISDYLAQRSSQASIRTGTVPAPRTLNGERALLREVFRFARMKGWTKEDPVRDTRAFPCHNERDRFLTPDEEKRLHDACPEPWFNDILGFNVDTGVRPAEGLAVAWNDVYLDARIPHVHIYRTKTNRHSHIPMTERVKEILTRLKQANPGGEGTVIQGR